MAQLIAWDDFGPGPCLSTSSFVRLLTKVSGIHIPALSQKVVRIYPYLNTGTLYRYDPDGSVHRMVEGVSVSNGAPFPVVSNLKELDGQSLTFTSNGKVSR